MKGKKLFAILTAMVLITANLSQVMVEGTVSTVTVNSGAVSTLAEVSGDYEYIVLEDGTVSITGYKGEGGDVVIPEEIEGKKVTKIDIMAFAYSTSITSVEISNNVTEIGYWAFIGCTSLTSIQIADSVTEIGANIGRDCTSLTNIYVNDKNTAYCSKDGILFSKDMSELIACPEGKKGSFIIPDSVTVIGAYAFYHCISFTSIEISNSVKEIEGYAFCNCTSITSIEIPNSVTAVKDYAFAGCTALTSVILPQNVIEFGNNGSGGYHNVFIGCSNNLTIYGFAGSSAETDAKKENINFTAITSIKSEGETNGIEVQAPAALPSNTILKAEKTNETEDSVTYNITLTSNGENVDLKGEKAIVKIPVPEKGNANHYKVFRKEADGSYTDMEAIPSNGCLLFFTDHFSEYIISTKTPENKPAEPAPTESTSAESTPTESTPADSTTTTTENAGGSKGEGNQPTGIILAVIPAIAAASAAIIFKKRK